MYTRNKIVVDCGIKFFDKLCLTHRLSFFFKFFSNIIFSLFTFHEIAFPFDFKNLTSTTKLHSFNVLFASELHLINIYRPSTYHVLTMSSAEYAGY